MKEVDSLKNIISLYQIQIHSHADSINNINQTLANAQQTIDRQSQLIAGFGTLYTALTGVLAFVTILIPILTYYFAIKPSRKAVKKMKKIIDSRVINYLEESKMSYLEDKVKVVESGEFNHRNKAISDLSNNHEYKLNENQIARLMFVFDKLRDPEIIWKFSLSDIICKYPSPYVDLFVKKILENDYSIVSTIVCRYMVVEGYAKFLSALISGIKKSNMIKSKVY